MGKGPLVEQPLDRIAAKALYGDRSEVAKLTPEALAVGSGEAVVSGRLEVS